MGAAKRSASAGWRSEQWLSSARGTTQCLMGGAGRLNAVLGAPVDRFRSERVDDDGRMQTRLGAGRGRALCLGKNDPRVRHGLYAFTSRSHRYSALAPCTDYLIHS